MIYYAFLFTSIFLFISAETEMNLKELFERYKNKYHREYLSPLSEIKAFYNFINNTRLVHELNNQTRSNVSPFMLNKYADLNPEEIKEHFAIEIQPYDNVMDDTKDTIEKQKQEKFLEEMDLYDLVGVDDLYHEWILKWGKVNYTKKAQRTIHYYRFIKSVVEINKKKLNGEDVTLGPDADVVKEPDEYFYG